MQRKTIQKTIQSYLNTWLATITDEQLREDTKNSLVVSGGSICSLFLKEPVNDYDIYLRDINVAYRLALYYAAEVIGTDNILIGTKKDEYLKEFDVNQHNITKVTLENLQPEQVKLRIQTGGQKTQHEDDGTLKFRPTFFSPNAISLSDKIQIVLRFTGTIEEIHKTFDFVHATNYFTFEEGLVTNLEAVESILTKQLRYQGSRYPLTTIIRIKKFLKRNWNINAGEQLKVMFQISELDLTNHWTLEDQLIGVDVAYFAKIIDILAGKKEKEPSFKLSYGYLCTLIDKVFNDEDDDPTTTQPN